jgi:hypothetical protein
VNDLTRLDPTKDAARIAHVVGQRKRLLILVEAHAKRIKVLNPGREQKAEGTPETKETSPRKKQEEVGSTPQQVPSEEAKGDKKEFKEGRDAREKVMQLVDQEGRNDDNRGEKNNTQEIAEAKPSEDKHEDETEVTKS